MKRRRAPYVWIVGPDGCGKSTLARAFAEESRAIHRYWRPGALPLARTLAGKRPEQGINSEPHSFPPNSPTRELARIAYYAADYVIGYVLIFRPALVRGQCVVVERGWHDMSVDWRRYRLRGPRAALRLARLVAEPDLIVIVSVPSTEIIRRKPELPAEEIERQYRAWADMPVRRARKVVLDNSGTSTVALSGLRDLVANWNA